MMKRFFRPLYVLYQCFAWVLVVIVTFFTGVFLLLFGKWFPVKGGDYYPALLWSRFMARIFLLPIKVEGKENLDPKQNYIFIANHQGMWDVFLMFGYMGRNFKWMMKESLRKVPVIGDGYYHTGHIFINRDAPQRECFVKALDILKKGLSLAIFAEGTRTRDGKIGEFKKGAFVIADMAQLPIVPVAIEGSFDLLPKSGIFMNWTRLKMTIMPPIQPIGKGRANVEYLMEESHKQIEKQLNKQ